MLLKSWLTVLNIGAGSPLDFLKKTVLSKGKMGRAAATLGEEVGALWRDSGDFDLWRLKGLIWTVAPILVLQSHCLSSRKGISPSPCPCACS